MSRITFHKTEKLKSSKQIAELFTSGRSVPAFPLKALWAVVPSERGGIKAGFAVPKRNFRRATDRNLLKRRLREAYRLNKYELASTCLKREKEIHLMFVYTSSGKVPFHVIEEAAKRILSKILYEVKK